MRRTTLLTDLYPVLQTYIEDTLTKSLEREWLHGSFCHTGASDTLITKASKTLSAHETLQRHAQKHAIEQALQHAALALSKTECAQELGFQIELFIEQENNQEPRGVVHIYAGLPKKTVQHSLLFNAKSPSTKGHQRSLRTCLQEADAYLDTLTGVRFAHPDPLWICGYGQERGFSYPFHAPNAAAAYNTASRHASFYPDDCVLFQISPKHAPDFCVEHRMIAPVCRAN